MPRHKTLLLVAALLLNAPPLVLSLAQSILPADRIYPWEGAVGVPGGMPNRTSIGATVNAAQFGNDSTDATQAIRDAVNACGPNQVAYLPEGTYKLTGTVSSGRKSYFSLRGAGAGKTIIKAAVGLGTMLQIGGADWPYPTTGQAVTSGATRGSTVLTVGDTSSFVVGNLCFISQAALSYVFGTDERPQSITFRVADKTARTITLDHPLPCDFPSSPVLGSYPSTPTMGVGIEGITLDGADMVGAGITMEQSWGYWMSDVEIKRSKNRQMFLIVCNQGTIRHCYTHDTYTASGPGHEGIDFFNRSCWNLVEDTICDGGGFPQIILGDSHGGCVGNAFFANYLKNTWTATDIGGADISFNHGAHNAFNLAEANICWNGISSDGYFGSSSHNTVFRNWCAAKPYDSGGRPHHATSTNGLRALQLNRMSNFYNVAGNVLGDSTFSATRGVYETEQAGYGWLQVIFQNGFPNMGNTGYSSVRQPTSPPSYLPDEGYIGNANAYQQLDLNVKNTLIRHGNYDYATRSLVWDSNISDRNLPASFIYSAKPAWWGNLPWPPIDPANPPGELTDLNAAKLIPAAARLMGQVLPTPTPGATPTPSPTPSPSPSVSPTPSPTPPFKTGDNIVAKAPGVRAYEDHTFAGEKFIIFPEGTRGVIRDVPPFNGEGFVWWPVAFGTLDAWCTEPNIALDTNPTPTPTPSVSPTPTATATPSATPTPTATPKPTPTPTPSKAYGPTLPVGWILLACADIDRDSELDLVLLNTENRRTAIWYLKGNVIKKGVYGPEVPAGFDLIDSRSASGKLDLVFFNRATRQTYFHTVK